MALGRPSSTEGAFITRCRPPPIHMFIFPSVVKLASFDSGEGQNFLQLYNLETGRLLASLPMSSKVGPNGTVLWTAKGPVIANGVITGFLVEAPTHWILKGTAGSIGSDLVIHQPLVKAGQHLSVQGTFGA